MTDLLDALSSPNWRDRKQAIEALASADDDRLYQALLDILRERHHDPSTLNAALQLLCQLNLPVTPGLIKLLDDLDPLARMNVVQALGDMGDPAAIPGLLNALADPSPNVRFNAIEALGKLGAQQAVEPLTAILQQGDFFLAFPAILALASIGDPRPIPQLLSVLKDELLGSAAVQALGALGSPDQVAGPVAAWLAGPLGEAEAAVFALTALARRYGLEEVTGPQETDQRRALRRQIVLPVGPAAREKLLAAASLQPEKTQLPTLSGNPDQPGIEFQEKNNRFLSGLAAVLGWLLEENPQDPAIQTGLLQLLNSPTARGTAGAALVSAGQDAVEKLSGRLSHPDEEVRITAARALGEIRSPEAVPALTHVLEGEDIRLAAAAAQALGNIVSDAGFEALIAHLDHPVGSVRQAVACALHELNHPSLIPRLLALLQEPDPILYEAVLRCLALASSLDPAPAGLPDAVLSAMRASSPATRKAVIEVLPLLHTSEADEALAQSLIGPDAAVHAAAAQALARCTPDFALPLLSAALSDPDPWTRLYACRSIAHHARPDSAAALFAHIKDPSPMVRIALAQALGQVDGPLALESLHILQDDPEEEVRQAAGLVLTQLES